MPGHLWRQCYQLDLRTVRVEMQQMPLWLQVTTEEVSLQQKTILPNRTFIETSNFLKGHMKKIFAIAKNTGLGFITSIDVAILNFKGHPGNIWEVTTIENDDVNDVIAITPEQYLDLWINKVRGQIVSRDQAQGVLDSQNLKGIDGKPDRIILED